MADKEVLDLGFVGHSLDACLRTPERWLHNRIRARARSVLGVDLLGPEVDALRKMGYDVLAADALALRLDRRFDAVVCADLIEHMSDPGGLLRTVAHHLRDDGIALVTTPNPFAANRFFNILLDKATPVNTEHVAWFCPQTLFQLAGRCGLAVDEFRWLETDFPMRTKRPALGRLANRLGPWLARRNGLFHTDMGVVLRKRREAPPAAPGTMPFVSVILPTRDRADFLEGALRSLAAQDYPVDRFEVIVVDNVSSDDTPRRVRRLMEAPGATVRIRYVREEREGLVFARHTGAAHAEGEILLYGDDDAVFDAAWISAVVAVYRRHPEVGAVGTKIEVRWDREPEPWVRRHESLLGRLDYGGDTIVKRGLQIYGGSFSIRKAVLRDLEGFNPGQKGRYIVGDSETGLCRKLNRAGIPVGWTPAATVWHLQRADVNGTLDDLKRRCRNHGICEAYGATFDPERKFGRLAADMYRRTASLIRTALGAILHGDRDRFRHELPLRWARLSQYARYLWLYRVSRSLRREIAEGGWEFDGGYRVPPAGFGE